MGNVVWVVPSDRVILSAIRTVCPEYYDKALDNYLKKLGGNKNG